MKLFIKYLDEAKVRDIIDKVVNAAGRAVFIEKPDIDKHLIEQVIKIVKSVMTDTMDTLLIGSSSTVIEFDIENAVAQTFENVLKTAKWEMEEGNLKSKASAEEKD